MVKGMAMSNALAKQDGSIPAEMFPALPQASAPDALEAAIAATQAPPARTLSREQKAAIIVRLLSPEASEIPLSNLDTQHMVRLVRATAGLRFVDEATTLDVIREFLDEMDSLAIYFRPGLEGAMTSLSPHLTDDVTTVLTSNLPPDAPEDPWIEVAVLPTADLASLLASETPQVCAIVLSKLTSGKAADVLGELDPDLARSATLAASQAERIEERTVFDIGLSIASMSAKRGDQGGLAGDPVERVGAMLNFTGAAARNDLLETLEKADSALFEKVRKIMFTFADIPDRIEVTDISKLVRAVENGTLVTALAGGQKSDPEVVEFILANLSKRLSEQLSEDIRDAGDVKPKDADTAMNTVIQAIRDLEAAGEIILIQPED